MFSFVFHLLCIPLLLEHFKKEKAGVIKVTVVLVALTVTVMKMLINRWKDQGKVRKDI
jgi:hypothetical protein